MRRSAWKLRRGEGEAFFAALPPCLVGMEACATAHDWARRIARLGHDVRLLPPAYVRPYVKRGKSDAAAAEAICEAVTRPGMRTAPAKSAEQQAILMLHRTRDLLVRQPRARSSGCRARRTCSAGARQRRRICDTSVPHRTESSTGTGHSGSQCRTAW
jgi:transposase